MVCFLLDLIHLISCKRCHLLYFEEAFQEVTDELDMLDVAREKVLSTSRKGIRECSRGIKKLHRQEDGVASSISEVREIIKRLLATLGDEKLQSLSRYLSTLYQEFVELVTFNACLVGEDIPKPSDIDPRPPALEYILGLCDLVGELRRASIDSIREERFDDATKFFKLMEQIHDDVMTLDYPNGLIPNVRHKSDVNRRLVNSTRSDLTMALQMHRLSTKLADLDSP